jgi:Zn finger protein HypA/HybF involved in hydrogenase expression
MTDVSDYLSEIKRSGKPKDVYEAAEAAMRDSLAIIHAVEVKHQKKVRVRRIVLGLGEMSGIRVAELAETLTGLVEGSALENCELEVVQVPGQVQCRCGFVGRPNIFDSEGRTIAECPKCRKEELLVRSGHGVEVQKVELA